MKQLLLIIACTTTLHAAAQIDFERGIVPRYTYHVPQPYPEVRLMFKNADDLFKQGLTNQALSAYFKILAIDLTLYDVKEYHYRSYTAIAKIFAIKELMDLSKQYSIYASIYYPYGSNCTATFIDKSIDTSNKKQQ